MLSRPTTLPLCLLLAMTMGGCGDATSTEGQECTAASADYDCPNISIWYPTCNGDVLETPTGTGERTCVNGYCQVDFDLVTTDCAAEGKTCGLNPDEMAEGDACLEDDASPGDECTVDTAELDCPNISIWYPTCNGDVLETPTGTGERTCVNGYCQVDFELMTTDCAAESKTCGPNPDGMSQGDACI